jgi:hypothetical protein
MRSFLMSLFFGLFFAVNAHAQALAPAQKLSDFNQLMAMVESGYGPLKFKAEKIGLTLEGLRAEYEPKIVETKTNGDFYYLMLEIVARFRDGHFGIYVPTTQVASLPITTDLVEGKVLIDTVDRAKLPEAVFPFEKGDEVVSINDEPTSSVLDRLQALIGNGSVITQRRSAAMSIFFRRGARLPVPTGKVVVEFRHGVSAITEKAELEWTVVGTPLDEQVSVNDFGHTLKRQNFDELSTRESMLSLLGEERMERSFQCSGNTRIAIPADATIIMMTPFVAYYHPTAKGNVGYLRIPHYSPSIEGTTDFNQRYEQYRYAVRILEKNTVGLVIDQDHNCGGSVQYLENILGLFMNKPYKPMQFRLLANKSQYIAFRDGAAQEVPNTEGAVGLAKVADLILTSWKAGEFMTPMTSISGIDEMQPSPDAYTKPIVMTIDEMSGSGGDAFPSYMKGYGRATLVGTHTMGLGGHVEEQPNLQYSQLTLRMTKSLFYRPDGVPVENTGAEPDVPYTITRDDFMYGYKGYQQFYEKVLLDKIQ